MLTEQRLQTILLQAREANVTDDDHAYVVNALPGDRGDYEIVALNVAIGLFRMPEFCNLPEVADKLGAHYDDEYADHEPWLVVVHEGKAIVMPLLPPRVRASAVDDPCDLDTFYPEAGEG